MNIQQGQPLVEGDYVVYIKYHYKPEMNAPSVCIWRDGKWFHHFRSEIEMVSPIHGWVGPIPAFKPVEYDL